MARDKESQQPFETDGPTFASLPDRQPAAAGPSPVDVHVGNRIRLRRTLQQMSQEKLGEALGLTFQQVQKYERGTNRVSASRLHDLSRVFDVPVNFFFDDMPSAAGRMGGQDRGSHGFGMPGGFAEAQDGFGAQEDVFSRKETIDLVRAYYRITDPAKRRKLLDLVKSMGPD